MGINGPLFLVSGRQNLALKSLKFSASLVLVAKELRAQFLVRGQILVANRLAKPVPRKVLHILVLVRPFLNRFPACLPQTVQLVPMR